MIGKTSDCQYINPSDFEGGAEDDERASVMLGCDSVGRDIGLRRGFPSGIPARI